MDDRQVALLPEHLECAVDDDCTIQSISRASCGSAVAKKHAAALAEEVRELCGNYPGPVADRPVPKPLPSGNRVCVISVSRLMRHMP